MKKFLSILFIAVICLAAVSCSSEPDITDPESDEAKQEAQEQNELLQAFSSGDFPSEIGQFSASDLNGNEVTDSYFENADVTLVHIWATFCDPCLEEMENLGKMAGSLPDNAQVLGIVADVEAPGSEECESAKQIVKDNDITFPNLCIDGDISGLVSNVVGVPTTIAVDSEGNIVADPVVGSDVLGYKRMALDYLESIGK